MEETLAGGRFAAPVRRGDKVYRKAGARSGNVHALLQHFEDKGFELTPRFLGFTDDGQREIVSFIEGETAYPPFSPTVRDDQTLVNVARAIRAIHDASDGFIPPEPGLWGSPEVALPVEADCIGHRDLGPWNFIFHATSIAGIIDWDFAGPTSRAWDLAYAAHHFVPFHATEGLKPWGWDTAPDRPTRLRKFVDAYGTGITPEEIVDLAIVRMTSFAAHIETQVRAANPAFATHRDEGHAEGYRAAARFIIDQRARLLA